MRNSLTKRRDFLVPAFGLVLVTAVSACSPSVQNPQYQQGSFSAAPSQVHPTAASAPAVPPSAGPAANGNSASAVAEITSSWKAFFSPSTPNGKRIQLLQNGSAFAPSVSAFASSPLAATVTSKVDSVALTSATQAKVKYDLTAAGTTVAASATGASVLQDGTWKVGDDVFCGLLNQARKAGLSIPVPAACSPR